MKRLTALALTLVVLLLLFLTGCADTKQNGDRLPFIMKPEVVQPPQKFRLLRHLVRVLFFFHVFLLQKARPALRSGPVWVIRPRALPEPTQETS